MSSESKSTDLCRGCREDFYNGHNDIGVKQCWNLESARVVRRWKLYWWTAPTVPGALVEVKTYNCHHEPGRFAFYEELPGCAVDPKRLKA